MNWLTDFRFAVRSLLKHPGFSAAAVLTLMLGVGMNTAVFILVDAVLLRGLPFEDAHRILYLECRNPSEGISTLPASYREYEFWKEETGVFSQVAAFRRFDASLADPGHAPEWTQAASLSDEAFALLRIRPLLGRGFRLQDSLPSSPPVALLGYRLWQQRYGGEEMLGREVRINGEPATIVGIMPQGFHFPLSEDLWVPLRPDAAAAGRDLRRLGVFARLADGAQLEEVRSRLDLLSDRLAQTYPASNQGVEAVAVPYNDKFNGGAIRIVFLTLLFAVGFLLLIVCANLANMTLARTLSRTRELALLSALGAKRWALSRRMLAESLLLALAGGIASLPVAILVVNLFSRGVASVEGKPYWVEFTFSPLVFLYLFAVCLAASLVFGLYPAWKAARVDLNSLLKEGSRSSGGRSSRRILASMVTAQMALSVLLLVGAGLLARSFLHLLVLDTGVKEENLLTLRLRFPASGWEEAEQRLHFLDLLLDRVRGLGGVREAALASHLPLGGAGNWPLLLQGQAPEPDPRRLPSVPVQVISPGYFHTMGSSLRAGRDFRPGDGGPAQPVAIVNQAFLRHWRETVPGIGARFRLYEGGEEEPGPWLEVIGVASDIRHNSPSDPQVLPLVYLPVKHFPLRSAEVLLRAPGDPYALADPARGVLRQMDPDLPFDEVVSLRDQLWQQSWPYRVFGGLIAVFALTALVLSTVGAYALASFAVGQRHREFGVRMALGATPRLILRLVLRAGILRLCLGMFLGLAAALGLSRVLHTLLVGVQPTDPLTFLTAAALIAICGLTASLLPARRASRINPVQALHE